MKRWKWLLVYLGSIGLSLACGYLLYHSFNLKYKVEMRFRSITTPSIARPVQTPPRWLRFKRHLDSLNRDSLEKASPGLMDSLEFLERLYHFKK